MKSLLLLGATVVALTCTSLMHAVEEDRRETGTADSVPDFSLEQLEFFERRIRPLLVEHCQDCHGPHEQKGNLRLDSRAALLRGGDTGPAVVPGQPASGELMQAVSYDSAGYQMPPRGRLPDESITLLSQWIAMGVPWPEERTELQVVEEFDLQARADHWSFRPLHGEPIGGMATSDWCCSPVDQFILAGLVSQNLTPAAASDRATWIRRAYLDVIGLPPSPTEVERFLADDSPEAYASVVDQLLASPRFGERWGRHWLDLTRYTETRGHQYDYLIPNTWHYRDYVIRAFNEDIPYDQLLVEHVAGDLLRSPAEHAAQPGLEAAGIHLDDMVRLESVTSSTFLADGQPAHADEEGSPDTTLPQLREESLTADAESTFTAEQLAFFEREVRPLLVERCQTCHGQEQQKGGLRLDSRAAILLGGDTGPAIVPGYPERSELVLAVRYDPAGYQMPPAGRLSDSEILALVRWVEMGAPWPDERVESLAREEFDFATRAARWAFQPLLAAAPPEATTANWPRTTPDLFLLDRLQQTGLAPSTEADRRTWLRRAYLDVIGLPPTPQQTAEFLNDSSPRAYETVVEQLLSSPHFGERWGRHWMDLVRFADSRGHEFDYDVPNGWHYRDYVIRALNDDLPYDQFMVEHLAGDLLSLTADEVAPGQQAARRQIDGESSGCDGDVKEPEDSTTCESATNDGHPSKTAGSIGRQREYYARYRSDTGANESILATGFWFFGEGVHSPVDIRQDEADRFDNMIDVFSKTFLGLTVACARCHDHKFDPIRQADFYALQGYLQSTSYRQARFETMDHNLRIAEQLERLGDSARPILLGELCDLVEPVIRRLPEYLTAARALTQTGPEPWEQLPSFAAESNLDPEVLKSWAIRLMQAAGEPTDPLHPIAHPDPAEFVQTALSTRLSERYTASEESAGAIPDGIELLFDAARHTFDETLVQDGVSFGTRVVQAGNILLGDADAPLAEIVVQPVVRRDPVWNGLRYTPETMDDPGRLSSWDRGGRTLRTHSFDITHGKLYLYLRGGCSTYVEVDSHILNNGPLHGSLMREHPLPEADPQGLTWRWVEHDVSRYRGHRAHLQVVLRTQEPLEIALIAQAESLPYVLTPAPLHPWWASLSQTPESLTTEAVLQALTEALAETIAALREEVATGQPLRRSQWALAEWIREHGELFGLNNPKTRERLREAAQPFMAERQRLLDDIRLESATAPCMLEISPEEEYIFIRGNWRKAGPVVPRRFLEVFSTAAVTDAQGESDAEISRLDSVSGRERIHVAGSVADHASLSGTRLDLALQMVDPQQTPIVPRVVVNRIWQHYFGRGLVPTPDDFGHLGEPPSHPELLDWLAQELVDNDWSLKHIHRTILLSSAYRMSSDLSDPHAEEIDPDNVLLHRMNVKRLEGEIIRDAMLSVSGRLDVTMFGPPIPVHLTPFLDGRGRPSQSGPVDGHGRRSIYISVRRNFLDPMFLAFDFPLPHTTIGKRTVSNVPAQALALMNSPLVHQLADLWARRMLAETEGQDIDQRIEWLYLSAFSRPATPHEIRAAREFLQDQVEEQGWHVEGPDFWSAYCHVLFNTKEFIFVR